MGDLTTTTVHVYDCIGEVSSHALSSANFITAKCWHNTKTDCCSLTSNCQPEDKSFKTVPLSPDEPCYAVVRPLEWSKQEDVDCRCVCQSISSNDEPVL